MLWRQRHDCVFEVEKLKGPLKTALLFTFQYVVSLMPKQ